MSAFYPGLSVRCVRCEDTTPEYNNVETQIVRRSVEYPDHWVLAIPPPFGYSDVCAHQRFLEPILPEGLESLDEINSLYEPEPCTADVGSRGFRVPAGGDR